MVTKEEYLSAFQFMENTTYSSFKYRATPNFAILSGIKLTLDNAKTMSEDEWNIWFATYKNDYEVLSAGLSTGLVPQKVVGKIVDNLHMVKTNTYERNKWTDEVAKDRALLFQIMKNDISKHDFNKITKLIGTDIFVFLGFTNDNIKENSLLFSNSALNCLALESIKSFTTEDFYSPFHTFGPEGLIYIRDEKFAKKLMSEKNMGAPVDIDEGQKEKIRSMLINNIYMSDDFRNELFREGCEINSLNSEKFTQEIVEEGYTCAAETFDEVYDFDKKCSKSGFGQQYCDMTIFLARLAETGQLPEAMEIDLAHRLINRGERNSDIVSDMFLQNTKNTKVLDMVDKFKHQDRMNIYDNPNVPYYLLKERVDNLFKKIVKDLDKGRKLTQVSFDYIGDYSKRIQLDNEQYTFLFMMTPKEKMIMNFIISDKTPMHILDDFLKIAYDDMAEIRYKGEIPVAIETVQFMRKNDFPKEFSDAIKLALKEKIVFNYETGDARKNLDKQIGNHMKETKELLDFFYNKLTKPIPNREWDSKKDLDVYKHFYSRISKEYKYYKEKDVYEKTGNIKGMSDENIDKLWMEIRDPLLEGGLEVHNGSLLLAKYAKDINVVCNEKEERLKALEVRLEEVEKLH